VSFPSALADGELNYAELFKSRAKPISYALLSALTSRIQVIIKSIKNRGDGFTTLTVFVGRISDSVIRQSTIVRYSTIINHD